MQYRKLGSTGIEVSEIGFGAWQLGAKLWNGEEDQAAINLVDEAVDLGCNFFDTAPGYGDGNSESLLGKALKGKRQQVVINTKFGHKPDGSSDFSAKSIRKAVEDSMIALQTDYLDGILLHNPSQAVLRGDEGHYEIFEQLKKEGYIRAYGASVDSSQDLRTMMDHSDSQIAEILFHALHQEVALAFEQARAKDIGLIVKVPLDSGWLSGKYTKDTIFNTGYRERWTDEVKARRAAYVEQLAFLQNDERTMAQGALRFILDYPEVSTVIPGSRNSRYLRDNMAASEGRLSDKEIQYIKALWQEDISRNPLPW